MDVWIVYLIINFLRFILWSWSNKSHLAKTNNRPENHKFPGFSVLTFIKNGNGLYAVSAF